MQVARNNGGGLPVTRVVDRLVIHGQPITFRELCRRAVPEDTRYLILDLDRTVHLGRNMGELFGWELCAYRGYGPEHLFAAEAARTPGRFFVDWSRPLSALRCLAVTGRWWAGPGLFYFLWGKLPSYLETARRWSYRLFGPDPVPAVQRIPQLVLMHQMSGLPASTLRMLAQRVWDRHRGDQVILREDLEWLRARCPRIRILISSASPQPCMEVAARELEVDDVLCSTVEEHDGFFSAPYQLGRLWPVGEPRRLAGPFQLRINSGRTKIDALLRRCPDLVEPGVVSVGISDNGYGEDRCWADHFTRVVDINSPTPYPPIVLAPSPAQEIHSASALTFTERKWRDSGSPNYVDPRRSPVLLPDRVFTRAELTELLGQTLEQAQSLASRFEEESRELAGARGTILEEEQRVAQSIDATVAVFNEAPEPERRTALTRLRWELRKQRQLRKQLARVERPLSEIAFILSGILASARERLTVAGWVG